MKPSPILPLAQLEKGMKKGQEIVVSGYGIYNMDTSAGGKLHFATVKFERRSSHEILLISSAGKDTCNGDSGGPAYLNQGAKRYTVGVTSRAADNANAACGEGGLYTLASAYEDWVKGKSEGHYKAPASNDGEEEGENGDATNNANSSDEEEISGGCSTSDSSSFPFLFVLGLLFLISTRKRFLWKK